MTRLALAIAAVVLMAGVGILLVRARAPQAKGCGSSWCPYRDSEHQFSLRYPANWNLQTTDRECPFPFWVVVVSNQPSDLKHPPELEDNCEATWDMRGLPAGLLAIELRHSENAFGQIAVPHPPTSFPLSLSDAGEATQDSGNTWGHPQPYYLLDPRIAGRDYVLVVWFGAGVSAQDRRLASQLVSSIRPTA